MINKTEAAVFIFIALDCEAKPLIQKFALKKQPANHPFAIYTHKNYVLTVTGLGKNAMAGAVAYTMALFPGVHYPVLLNLGIAGHKTQPIGKLLLAVKIVDMNTDKHYYPQLSAGRWPETSELKTSSVAVTEYAPDCLYDMESSAFYEMAVKFTSSELIHCLKVVSDNELSSIEQIQPKTVNSWVTGQVSEIEQVINNLLNFRTLVAKNSDNEYQQIVEKWHFTVAGEIKLKALLQRWQVLSAEQWLTEEQAGFRNAKAVLQKLESDINHLQVLL